MEDLGFFGYYFGLAIQPCVLRRVLMLGLLRVGGVGDGDQKEGQRTIGSNLK